MELSVEAGRQEQTILILVERVVEELEFQEVQAMVEETGQSVAMVKALDRFYAVVKVAVHLEQHQKMVEV
jgi:hypothetical protein